MIVRRENGAIDEMRYVMIDEEREARNEERYEVGVKITCVVLSPLTEPPAACTHFS